MLPDEFHFLCGGSDILYHAKMSDKDTYLCTWKSMSYPQGAQLYLKRQNIEINILNNSWKIIEQENDVITNLDTVL